MRSKPYVQNTPPFIPGEKGLYSLPHGRGWSGYELDDHTLSPIDSVALIPMRPPKSPQKGQVLDPSWTLEFAGTIREQPEEETIPNNPKPY
jgi:hypothetical protein